MDKIHEFGGASQLRPVVGEIFFFYPERFETVGIPMPFVESITELVKKAAMMSVKRNAGIKWIRKISRLLKG